MTFLAAWVLIPLPFAIAFGKYLKARNDAPQQGSDRLEGVLFPHGIFD